MAEYSKLARGSFVTGATPVAQVINLPFQPTQVELTNVTAFQTPGQNKTAHAYWDISMGQDVAAVEFISAASFPWVEAVDFIPSRASAPTFPGGGISTFACGLSFQFGPKIQIASITKANPAVVTTATAHGLSTGDVIILEGLFQSPTTGMIQITNLPFTVTVTGATTFTIPFNTNQSNFTALSGSPAGAFMQAVLCPFLYLPGVNFISSLDLSGTFVTVTTTTNHNYVVGQEIAFIVPTTFGSTQLDQLPNNITPGSPIYFYVSQLLSNNSFVCTAVTAGVTAFNSNQTFAGTFGRTWAQVIAAGDVNSGGFPFTGGQLYPSPSFPTFSGGMPTINGPAIAGAFVNNTRQGFVVGLGFAQAASAAASAATAPLLTPSSLYFYEAKFFDIG